MRCARLLFSKVNTALTDGLKSTHHFLLSGVVWARLERTEHHYNRGEAKVTASDSEPLIEARKHGASLQPRGATLVFSRWMGSPRGTSAPNISACPVSIVTDTALLSTCTAHARISHKAILKSSCKCQFPHKPVNLFFIFLIVKDRLTDLWGS
jgi:hypothetical protein